MRLALNAHGKDTIAISPTQRPTPIPAMRALPISKGWTISYRKCSAGKAAAISACAVGTLIIV
jgi:hypothetical protein